MTPPDPQSGALPSTGHPPLPEHPTRLHQRLIRHYLLVLLIPALSIPLLSMTYLYRESLKNQRQQNLVKAVQHTRYVERLILAKATETLVVGQFPETRRLINAEHPVERQPALESLEFRVRDFLGRNPELFNGVVYLDRRGRPVLNIRSENAAPDARTPENPKDYSDHPSFVGAMHLAAIQGQPLPVHFYHPTPRGPLIFSTLLKDDEGVISGVMLLKMDLEGLIGKIREDSPGTVHMLFNEEGESLLASPVAPEFDMRSALRRKKGTIPDPAWFPKELRVFSRIQPRGQSAVRWTAVYAMPLTTLDSSFRNALLIIGGVTLASLVFSVALAISFSRRVTRPIMRLAVAARDIANGYWDTRVPDSDAPDEVGTLTRAFASMSRQLRNARESLMRNLEDLRKSEAHLSRESERLEVTLRSIGDAVVATDLEGRIRLMNPVAEHLLAMDAERAMEKRFSDLLTLRDPVSGENVSDLVGMVGKNPDSPSIGSELKLENHQGGDCRIEYNATHIRDPENKPMGVVIVMRDVTRVREIALERNRAEKLESLGVLTGGIAHDFNNLMSVILGDLSLLGLKMDAKDRNYPVIQNATRAAMRARDLTRQLMAFSKGGTPVKETKFLPHIIRESADFALHGANCVCEIEAGRNLWPAEVDAAQIHQVFHNLILNAQQAMPESGVIRINLENLRIKEGDPLPLSPGPYVKIDVMDSGPGIPSNELNRIFDPYFTTRKTGSGLGLSSVFSIVQSHEGHIDVHSGDGGSTFTIYLPANERARPAPGPREPSEPEPPPSHNILVLDDEPGIRLTIRRLLEHLGHRVTTAATGQETLDAYEKSIGDGQPFDLLILDLTIPGGFGGREVARKLREKGAEVKIIVSSGYSHDDVMANHRKYGFDGMIQKPYSIKELSKTLSEVLLHPDSDAKRT